MFKRSLLTLISIFALSLISLTSTKVIFADDSTVSSLYETQSAIKEGTGLESWQSTGMDITSVKVLNSLVGDIPDIGSSATSMYIPGGAFGTMNRMIAALNTPPASGIEYIAQVKDSFLGKPAYAQGVGFTGLQFLLPLWRGFRNVVYVLASIIFIAIGIMIMLRIKISPQAVITIQSSIPKLITTLILVTFSYAIAGLVIDVCNLVEGLVIALLFSIKGVSLTESLFPSFWAGTGFPILSDAGNIIGTIFKTKSSFTFSSLSNPDLHTLQLLTYRAVPGWFSLVLLGGLMGSIVLGFFLGGIGNAVLGATGSSITDMVGRVVGGAAGGLLGGLIIPIVLCIIVGIWLIKLYFGLLKNYVTIIFHVIFAPLEIGIGAFPNSKTGFSSWLLNILANMAVFPVVGIFLVIINMVIDAVAQTNVGSSSLTSAVWAPSLISSSTLFNTNNTGGITPSIIAACIGLAGLALISKLPDMVPQYIFMIKPSPWGQAIGQGLEGAVKDVQNSTPYQAGETYAKSIAAKKTGQAIRKYGPTQGMRDFGEGLQDIAKDPNEVAKLAAEKVIK